MKNNTRTIRDLKIQLFTGSFLPQVGGMEYVVHYLAEALLDEGFQVIVMAKSQNRPDNFSYRYKLIRYGLPFRGGFRFRIDHFSAYLKLQQLHKILKVDIANIHNVAVPPELSLSFFKKKQIPVVMTPHGEDVQRVPEIKYGLRLDSRWDRKIRRHLMAADSITAISDSIKLELDFIDQSKLFIVPNGIHTQLFEKNRTDFLQKMFCLKHDAHFILSVGRNHIKKGYKYGIKAISELHKRNQLEQWYYAIVGKGVSELKSQVYQLGLSDKIFLIETLPPEKIRMCYNSSHIFFSPSIVEGLSLVSIEAMACGLPLVVTNVPGNQDIVCENRCGLIVKNKNVEDMAAGLLELILNDSYRESMGDLAYLRSSNYDWKAIAKRYLSVYLHTINNYKK